MSWMRKRDKPGLTKKKNRDMSQPRSQGLSSYRPLGTKLDMNIYVY